MSADSGVVYAVFLAMILIAFVSIAVFKAVVDPKNRKIRASSNKFPPPFSSSLTRKEILTAIEARLTNITSLRQQWKTTEKVESVGRYQAMLNIPYNFSGGVEKVSFILNLLATSKESGGCTVEWNYVIISPFAFEPMGLSVIAEDIYKNTTLEIRSALFTEQGDVEEAEYLDSKTEPQSPSIEMDSAPEPLKLEVPIAQSAERSSNSYVLPDIVGEELKHIPGTTGDASLMQVPDVQSQMPSIELTVPANDLLNIPQNTIPIPPAVNSQLGTIPNTLNFAPPDQSLSSNTAKPPGGKCIKCSQDRDPSFNFCLYCGYSDAKSDF